MYLSGYFSYLSFLFYQKNPHNKYFRMITSFESFQKRRLQTSYVSVVISISLVLFMVGILGLILLKSENVASYFKEKITLSVFIKDGTNRDQIFALKTKLKNKKYSRKVIFVSKEQAAKSYSREVGEDFLQFLGTNPLKDGIDIYLKASYVTPEKMELLQNEIAENKLVADISYDKLLVELLTKNIQRVSFWLLVVSSFFGTIAILLINSSIRLSIYSKRFNIKTMQMVGATKSFIRRPFILQSVKLSLIGAFIAILGVFVIIYYINIYIPGMNLLKDYYLLTYLTAGILAIAFVITWISTFFATQRFLNLQTNDLYH